MSMTFLQKNLNKSQCGFNFDIIGNFNKCVKFLNISYFFLIHNENSFENVLKNYYY
jgi:hypothetical protein